MAFVCKSERVLKFNHTDITPKPLDQLTNPQLGPGVYLGQQQFISNTRPALAPFQSSKIREVTEVTNINPGPGEYQVHIGFDKNNQQPQLLDTILAKIQRQKPGFNSNADRFQQSLLIKNDFVNLGPGAYETTNDNRQQWLKSNKNINILRARSQMKNNNYNNINYIGEESSINGQNNNKTQQSIIHHSPPSIPSGDFKFGYKIEKDGYHVISLKALETDKVKPEQRLGPGAYQNLDGFVKNSSKLVPYNQDTSKRSKINLDKPTKILGPGTYEILKPIHMPTYKNDPNYPSSMFASQTKRYSSVDPLVQNKAKLRMQLRRMTHHDSVISRNQSNIDEGELSKSNIIDQGDNNNNSNSVMDQSFKSPRKLTNQNLTQNIEDSNNKLDQTLDMSVKLSPLTQNNTMPKPLKLQILKKDMQQQQQSNNINSKYYQQRSRSTLGGLGCHSHHNSNHQYSQLKLGNGLIGVAEGQDYNYEDADYQQINDQEVEKLLDKLTPGPGQYIGQDKFSSFKKEIKPPKYQFFGSQAERFQEKTNLDNKLKQRLGPGCYQYDPEQIGKQKVTFKTVGFSTEIDRFYVRDRKIPGPGYYKNTDEALNAIRNPLSHNKLLTAFGTYEKRFVKRDNKIPGPGDYKPERSIQALQNKKHEILSGSSAFLAQDTERRIADPVLEHSPPVGSYNPENAFTLGGGASPRKDYNQSTSKLDRSWIMQNASQQSSIISSRKIQTLRSKSTTKVPSQQQQQPIGFNSEVKRFDNTINQANKDKLSPIRGPGYYDTNELTSLKPKKGNQDYFTQSKRFEYGSYIDKNKMNVPGPGQYIEKNDLLSKKNKSFNLMFN